LLAVDVLLLAQGLGRMRWRLGNQSAAFFALLSVHVFAAQFHDYGAILLPISYAVLAYFVGLSSRRRSRSLIAFALFLEFGSWMAAGALESGAPGLLRWLLASMLVVLFASLQGIVQRLPRWRALNEYKQKLQREQRRVQRRVQELGLDRAHAAAEEDTRSGQFSAAVQACEEAASHHLGVLRHGLAARTAALYWLNPESSELELREAVSELSLVHRVIRLGEGVIGSVAKRAQLLRLDRIRRDFPGLSYYRGQPRIGAFMAMPITEGGEVRGVLCVDREEERAFSPEDENIAAQTCRFILRSIRNERASMQLEQERFELERFYEASRALANALELDDVFRVSMSTVASIARFDVAAITLYDPSSDVHTVAAVWGPGMESIEKLQFRSNQGLVSMVVKRRTALPCKGEAPGPKTPIFDRETRIVGIGSLIVLPLVSHDKVLGSLVLGAKRVGAFKERRLNMLEVICNQVAVAIANGQLFAQMEQLASTDGLTKLLNRRTFGERMRLALARAQRHGQPATVILTDIDFFKKVNDTHGHSMGDEVLRQVARCLSRALRCTDLVGRYGGEEFVILLEDTDTRGGLQMAERLRKLVEALSFSGTTGSFRVTLSLGIATYGVDAETDSALIERADLALYACKEAGRNRSMAFSALAVDKAA
jgi:diguanylate cyclase (GGDEF)-like protein